MPNRILRESICKSDSIDQLTWFEEVVFYRLIVICDDYGRYDARPKILKADMFPLKDGVTLTQIEKTLNNLSTAGMVQVYEYDQKPFLQLINWEKYQNIRNHKSKYPQPPNIGANNVNSITNENNCNQMISNVPVIQSVSLSESVSESLYGINAGAPACKQKNTQNRFIKPSVEEIKAYCLERKNNIDPQYFFDFYESKDWYVGKNKMRNWKSSVNTWEKNNYNSNVSQKGSGNIFFDLPEREDAGYDMG